MDEQTKTSIVRIYKKQDSTTRPIGCGFLAKDRTILTCWHVIRDALYPEKDLVGKEGHESAIGCYLYNLFIYATWGVAKWAKEVQSLDS